MPITTPATPSVLASTKAYVEHVAIRVKDIHWHIRFFHDVLGMTAREIDGTPENPKQYWSVGGIQLMASPDWLPAPGETGQLAHLGVMVEDLNAALKLAEPFGVGFDPVCGAAHAHCPFVNVDMQISMSVFQYFIRLRRPAVRPRRRRTP